MASYHTTSYTTKQQQKHIQQRYEKHELNQKKIYEKNKHVDEFQITRVFPLLRSKNDALVGVKTINKKKKSAPLIPPPLEASCSSPRLPPSPTHLIHTRPFMPVSPSQSKSIYQFTSLATTSPASLDPPTNNEINPDRSVQLPMKPRAFLSPTPSAAKKQIEIDYYLNSPDSQTKQLELQVIHQKAQENKKKFMQTLETQKKNKKM